MGRIIMVLYMEALLLSVLTIWFLYHIIKKKKIFRWENAPLDMRDFVKRNEKRMNMISNGIIGIILIPAFLRVVLPAVQDFPNINSGNYLEVEGTVTSWNYSDEDKNKTRAIGIMDNKTKKEIFELIKEYSVPKELTAPLLNAMIEKILIHEATTNEENERIQEIEIYYRFIGKVD